MLIPIVLWSCIAAITPPLFAADVQWLRLPNRLLLAGGFGVVAMTAAGGVVVPALGVIGGDGGELPWARAAPFAAGSAALVVFGGMRMLGVIGMGDVKLAALLAAALGFLPHERVVPALALSLFVAMVCAGATAVVTASMPTRPGQPDGAAAVVSPPVVSAPVVSQAVVSHPVVSPAVVSAAVVSPVARETARTQWMPFGPFLLAGFWFAVLLV